MHEMQALYQLLRLLQHVPYLASKNVYRVAAHFLDMSAENLEQFCLTLKKTHAQLTKCRQCFFWTEKEKNCFFCANTQRDQGMICVVEQWYDVLIIERTQGYKGVYHILEGVISPLDGVTPDKLTVDTLIHRVEHGAHELIFALSQTPEGEATATYIAHKVKSFPVSTTCLARGLPVGSSLGSIDRITVFKALSERRPF